jgi:hypothetical protein
MEEINKRLTAIEKRNAKVEQDKAWETSWTRRISITLLTYTVIVIYLHIIHNDKPFINAAVPAMGFFLSTLVLKQIRIIWQDKR